ncbi:hypothetical protein EI77_00687 [Prosthecobacter fusiformis]|uniref:Uncharacterized protein n=1 Tax=Prosthecobacter fusiformis TaxID=48464 RepID=A0A4R7SRV8_9BACT|nr:hypothetical protein EI77_00687 [Prosthecobacter fusiformis]
MSPKYRRHSCPQRPSQALAVIHGCARQGVGFGRRRTRCKFSKTQDHPPTRWREQPQVAAPQVPWALLPASSAPRKPRPPQACIGPMRTPAHSLVRAATRGCARQGVGFGRVSKPRESSPSGGCRNDKRGFWRAKALEYFGSARRGARPSANSLALAPHVAAPARAWGFWEDIEARRKLALRRLSKRQAGVLAS